jgi:hypothetical protein
VRLEIEHRGTVDRVEPADREGRAIDAEQLADADTDSVRPPLRALRVDADLGPLRIAARPPRVALIRSRLDQVEVVDDLDVRELLEALEALRSNHLTAELDRRLDLAPVVVERLRSRRPHDANRLDDVALRI